MREAEHSLVTIVTRQRVADREIVIRFWQGQETLLASTAYGVVLRLTQPPVQWASGASRG
jgi:hypothetical protein